MRIPHTHTRRSILIFMAFGAVLVVAFWFIEGRFQGYEDIVSTFLVLCWLRILI